MIFLLYTIFVYFFKKYCIPFLAYTCGIQGVSDVATKLMCWVSEFSPPHSGRGLIPWLTGRDSVGRASVFGFPKGEGRGREGDGGRAAIGGG